MSIVWHCLKVHATHENMDVRVAADIAGRGVDAYLATKWVRNADRKLFKPERWLFPHLFFAVDHSPGRDDMTVVKETLGVAEIFSYVIDRDGIRQSFPKSVPTGVIKGMRADELRDLHEDLNRVRRKTASFKVGDRVVVIEETSSLYGEEYTVSEARPGAAYVTMPNGWPWRFDEEQLVPAHMFTARRTVRR